jgi:hypothetical protein
MSLVRRAIVRHYYSGDHAPYRGNLHDETTDAEITGFLDDYFRNLPDRAPIQITITILGEPRLDLPKWVLLEPHFYGPERGRAPWPKNYAYYSEACLKHGKHEGCDKLSMMARDLPYPQGHKRGPCRCECHELELKTP